MDEKPPGIRELSRLACSQDVSCPAHLRKACAGLGTPVAMRQINPALKAPGPRVTRCAVSRLLSLVNRGLITVASADYAIGT